MKSKDTDKSKKITLIIIGSAILLIFILLLTLRIIIPKIIVNTIMSSKSSKIIDYQTKKLIQQNVNQVPKVLKSLDISNDKAIRLIKGIKVSSLEKAIDEINSNGKINNINNTIDILNKHLKLKGVDIEKIKKEASDNISIKDANGILKYMNDNRSSLFLLVPLTKDILIEILKKK